MCKTANVSVLSYIFTYLKGVIYRQTFFKYATILRLFPSLSNVVKFFLKEFPFSNYKRGHFLTRKWNLPKLHNFDQGINTVQQGRLDRQDSFLISYK